MYDCTLRTVHTLERTASSLSDAQAKQPLLAFEKHGRIWRMLHG